MSSTLAIIYTITNITDLFDRLCGELLPGIQKINIVDETILKLLLRDNGLTPDIYRRVNEDVIAAETAGADVILLSCSSISPCADIAKHFVSVPVLKIDERTAAKAISIGVCIGVVATATTALEPTRELIQTKSQEAGVKTKVDAVLCKGAHEALLCGNMQKHDRIVSEYLSRAIKNNEVIVLAQASMARVAGKIQKFDSRVPILSSPHLAIEGVREILSDRGKE